MQQATYIIENPLQEVETGTLEVSGTGRLLVVNTGGSSSSEGGMGSGKSEDKVKGDLSE